MTARPASRGRRPARRFAATPLLAVLLCGVLIAAASPATARQDLTAGAIEDAVAARSAQDDDTTTTLPPVRDGDSPINDIVPEPNSGTAPEKPSDRGGWQQIMVFGLLVGGMGVIVLLVRRESRAARRRAQG